MTRIISIEGNIGSGKSTLVKKLQDYDISIKSKLKICFLQEPVDVWNSITNTDGKNILESYYADQKQFAFSFQMMAYISRIHTIKEALKQNYDIIITERSVLTDKNVFAQMLYDEGKINMIEFKIYNLWFNEFLKDIPQIEIIYLKTSPQIAYQRVLGRARQGEIIPLEYLINCDKYHNNWLNYYIETTDYVNMSIFNGDDDTVVMIDTYWKKLLEIIYAGNCDKFSEYEYTLTFDGASRGNPGKCGVGFVIWNDDEVVFEDSQYISDNNTNNYAEYTAVIVGLKKCIGLDIKSLLVKGDSLLVIKQVNNEYKVLADNLKPLHATVTKLSTYFNKIRFQHILRNENKRADKLANDALDNLANNDTLFDNYCETLTLGS